MFMKLFNKVGHNLYTLLNILFFFFLRNVLADKAGQGHNVKGNTF